MPPIAEYTPVERPPFGQVIRKTCNFSVELDVNRDVDIRKLVGFAEDATEQPHCIDGKFVFLIGVRQLAAIEKLAHNAQCRIAPDTPLTNSASQSQTGFRKPIGANDETGSILLLTNQTPVTKFFNENHDG
jgi:hypothetical protein